VSIFSDWLNSDDKYTRDISWHNTHHALITSDVNKDWTCKDKDKDKDQAYKDQDKDLTHKDQDNYKDLNMVLKKSLSP